MASTYRYRVFKSSWGIAVDLTAKAVTCTEGALPVTDNLYLRLEDFLPLTVDEPSYLVQGLRLVAAKLQALAAPDVPIVIHVLAIEFNECDYLPEGLTCAIAGWAAQEYGFEPPAMQVTFDRQANRYHFDFSQNKQDALP